MDRCRSAGKCDGHQEEGGRKGRRNEESGAGVRFWVMDKIAYLGRIVNACERD